MRRIRQTRPRRKRDKGKGASTPQPRRSIPQSREWTKRDIDRALDYHLHRRSPQARRTDEALVAPIAGSLQQWMKNPDEYDIHGVDYPEARSLQLVDRKYQAEFWERYREAMKAKHKLRLSSLEYEVKKLPPEKREKYLKRWNLDYLTSYQRSEVEKDIAKAAGTLRNNPRNAMYTPTLAERAARNTANQVAEQAYRALIAEINAEADKTENTSPRVNKQGTTQEKKSEATKTVQQAASVDTNEINKLIRDYVKKTCPTVKVRKGRGTAGEWLDITGSKDKYGAFTEEEKRQLKSLGIDVAKSNLYTMNHEDKLRFLKHNNLLNEEPGNPAKPRGETLERWKKLYGEGRMFEDKSIILNEAGTVGIVVDPDGAEGFLKRVLKDAEPRTYPYISRYALTQYRKNSDDDAVKVGGTMVDPGRLSEALRILGQRDITVTAAENSPITLANPQGETILIAPMISYAKTEPQLPSLDEVNMTREEEKQHRAKWRQARRSLRELLTKLYEEQDPRLRHINYMDWGDPTDRYVKRTLDQMRRYPAYYTSLAEELWGRETLSNHLTGEKYVAYHREPPGWWRDTEGFKEDREYKIVSPVELEKQKKRYGEQIRVIENRIAEREKQIESLRKQEREADWRKAIEIRKKIEELQKQNTEDRQKLDRW